MTSTSRTQSLEDILPCSPLQEGLLFHTQAEAAGADPYIVQMSVGIDGDLDSGRLKIALNALSRRHATLRAGFWHEGVNRPVQMIARDVPLLFAEHDLAALDDAAARTRIAEHEAQERKRPFDVGNPPLIRYVLLRLGPRSHRLVLTLHHILLDGWSLRIVLQDLWALDEQHGIRRRCPR